MRTSKMRSRTGTRILVGGVAAFVMFAAACSGGDKHVTVGTSTTQARDEVSSETSTTTASTKTTVKNKRAHTSTTTTTKAGASARNLSGPGTTAGDGGGAIYVPVGGTTPTSGTPTTPRTTPGTTVTPTTVRSGPKPYDPSKPIDLSGTPGVTPEEQARAEKLVRDTLRDLPHWADYNTARAEGYRTIGDGPTGYEHFINWDYLSDTRILDTKHPESLVYKTSGGGRTLVAAMFTLELGSSFADVPDIGGPLTQWHIHNDLCLFDVGGGDKQVTIKVNGVCPNGSTPVFAVPMIHVWIVKNYCGPFASLEGIGAGQVPPGETRNCDRAHGSG